MSAEKPDAEDGLRQLLGVNAERTSSAHDDAVLRAAREFAEQPATRRPEVPRLLAWLQSSWRWAAVLATLVAVGVVVSFAWQARQAADSQLLASVVLSPGQTRGEDELARITLPAAGGTVQLQLDLATVEKHAAYRAEVHAAKGAEVWRRENLKVRIVDWGEAVFVDLPSSVLEPGEYELTLQGAANGATAGEQVYYSFAVQRPQ